VFFFISLPRAYTTATIPSTFFSHTILRIQAFCWSKVLSFSSFLACLDQTSPSAGAFHITSIAWHGMAWHSVQLDIHHHFILSLPRAERFHLPALRRSHSVAFQKSQCVRSSCCQSKFRTNSIDMDETSVSRVSQQTRPRLRPSPVLRPNPRLLPARKALYPSSPH